MGPADTKVLALEERAGDDQVSDDSRLVGKSIGSGKVEGPEAASGFSYIVLSSFKNTQIGANMFSTSTTASQYMSVHDGSERLGGFQNYSTPNASASSPSTSPPLPLAAL